MPECRSIRSGAFGLPYYCAPLVCVSAVMESLAVWRHNKPQKSSVHDSGFLIFVTRIRVILKCRPFAIYSMVHCGSAFEPGASGLPYYCASICARSCCTWRASSVDSKPKKNKKTEDLEVIRCVALWNCPHARCVPRSVLSWKPGSVKTMHLLKAHTMS